MVLEPVRIGEIVRRAHVFNFSRTREGRVDEGDLLRAVDALFALLEERKIDYVLVGGIALLHYIKGRNTEDLDLIVAVASLGKLPEIQIVDQSDFFARGTLGQLKIDFLLTRNRLFEYVCRQLSTSLDFDGRRIRCATVEGLLLLKFYALPSLYRQGDFVRVGLYENDVATLMEGYRPNLAPLLDTLQIYLNAPDFNAVQEIVGEIKQRIERFDRGIAPQSSDL
jgi:hypothetical protein